jgi:uncharacterized protein (TIGR03663 family)
MQAADSNASTPRDPTSLRKRFLKVSANIQMNSPKWFWIFAGALVFLAMLSRFVNLGDKAFHHDESLHAYYSYRVSTGSPHEYSALLHGPFLYYFVGVFMWFFGATDFTARLAAALFSVALVALPLVTRKQLGRATTLWLMALFLISPTFWYFGRFLREDAFTSFWVLGVALGSLLFWKTQKPWALYFATSMLAFHFVNKENSFLHVFIWLFALCCIAFLQKKYAAGFAGDLPSQKVSPILDRNYLIINSISIFVTIFILFYSSFFRHSKGSLHGILDGLYRESLLYWWDQNQKRRIDGPFDYHLPLIANYEFFVLPFLAFAWARLTFISQKAKAVFWNSKIFVTISVTLLLATFLLPRVALVPEACTYTSFCLNSLSPNLSNIFEPLVKAIHVAHSRHVLQIICYLVFGASGFLASLVLNRRFEAFLWFWGTGAIGIYSYVGEKVPWLLVYILIPVLLICSIELGRIFGKSSQKTVLDTFSLNSASFCEGFSNRVFAPALIWIFLALPFTLFKGFRVSFLMPDAPQERLVFTQTTPQAKQLRDRWREARARNSQKQLKIAMSGDATWPYAWYVNEFQAGDFTRPTAENAAKVDAFFLDQNELEKAKKEFPQFRIYSLSMRHWWVPGQNPSLSEILSYFFTQKLYPRIAGAPDTDLGVGDTKVLYLENTLSPYWTGLDRPSFMDVLAEATVK